MKNAKRLLAVKEILQKYSDENHPISLEDMKQYLENDYHIFGVYRKTLNQDLRILEEIAGLEILYQHKRGYYCHPHPFSLAELKILMDSFSSLAILDSSIKEELLIKCSSFCSQHQFSTLKKLQSLSDGSVHYSFLYQLELLLEALQRGNTVQISHHQKTEEIIPLFFERKNDHYYLLYSYPHKKKIYRLLFENIDDLHLLTNHCFSPFTSSEIYNYLQETHHAYHGENLRIEMQLMNETKPLKRWLKNDFPNIEFYKNKAYIKSSYSPRIFSTLSAYGKDIKVLSPADFVNEYTEFLSDLLKHYQ